MHGQASERPPDGYTWSGRRLPRKQTTSRTDNVWPDMWKHMSDAAKKKAKQWWAIEKPKLDNARQWRGIFFIELNDEKIKLTMKSARRKLEVPMPAAMPCKIRRRKYKETCRNPDARKTKYACIVEADESTRKRLEGTLRERSWRPHCRERNQLVELEKSRAQIHSDALSTTKFQMQRRQWRNSEKNWRKIRHGSWRKSETKKGWSKKQGMRATPYTLRH